MEIIKYPKYQKNILKTVLCRLFINCFFEISVRHCLEKCSKLYRPSSKCSTSIYIAYKTVAAVNACTTDYVYIELFKKYMNDSCT